MEEGFKIVFFDDLVINKDTEDEYYVGRTSINSYVLLPEIAVIIIEDWKQGYSLEDTEEKYSDYEIDFQDFIEGMIDCNFVQKAGDDVFESLQTDRDKGLRFDFISKKFSKLIVNKYVALSIIVLFIYALYLAFSSTTNYLSYENVFWCESLLILVIVAPVFDFITGMIHEFAHFFAMRRYSDDLGSLSLSRRLTHLVYQTRLDNIWLVPKPKRLVIYLSGILSDILLISIFIIMSQLNIPETLKLFLAYGVLHLTVGIIFQFKFYMKTDIYYVISELVGNASLYEDSKLFLRSLFAKDNETVEKSTSIVMYSILLVLGSSIDLALTFIYVIPVVKRTIKLFNVALVTQNYTDLAAVILTVLIMIIELMLLIKIYLTEKKDKLNAVEASY